MDENRNRANEIDEENIEMMPDHPKPLDTFSAEMDSHREFTPKEDVSELGNPRQKLYRAAMEGKWKIAQQIFEKYGIAKTAIVSTPTLGLTALHVAACSGRSDFVEKLVGQLHPEDLEASDLMGRTALHFVAMAASASAAKAMVKMNSKLPQLRDLNLDPPIMYAARWRHRSKNKKMLEYLCQVTEEDKEEPIYTGPSGKNLIVAITASGCYDIALRILVKYPELATAKNENGMSILRVFAMRPSAFHDGSKPSVWVSIIHKVVGKEETIDGSDDENSNVTEHRQPSVFVPKQSPFIKGMKMLKKKQPRSDSLELVKFVCGELQKKDDLESFQYFLEEYNGNALLPLAVENGVYKLVEVCLKYFPELIWTTRNSRTLLHEAIEHRRVDIFNHLMDLIGENTKIYADFKDEKDNSNILHLAAKYSAPSDQLMIHSVPGPTFMMQRELQWFKAVEALVYEELTMEKNKMKKEKEIICQVPRELFYKQHENLLNDAKQWMKETSNSCMVVATLVATVAFAAIITVPGGNNSDTGLPILSNRKLFMAFCIADTLSMISSAITLLMFLSVYTSRFTEKDFMDTFPNILLRGLISLFIAVAAMMVAFGTAIGLALQNRVKWAYIPITVLACCPALIFTKLQLPLLFQTIVFASGPGKFREQRDRNSWCLHKIGYCLLSKNMS